MYTQIYEQVFNVSVLENHDINQTNVPIRKAIQLIHYLPPFTKFSSIIVSLNFTWKHHYHVPRSNVDAAVANRAVFTFTLLFRCISVVMSFISSEKASTTPSILKHSGQPRHGGHTVTFDIDESTKELLQKGTSVRILLQNYLRDKNGEKIGKKYERFVKEISIARASLSVSRNINGVMSKPFGDVDATLCSCRTRK